MTTDVFDRFLSENDLLDFAIHGTDDEEITRRFLEAPFPISLLDSLLAFLEEVHYPLAVRSSSLLEDSQYQPFSGVYETFMLANQHPDIQVRLEQLMEAIKLVYASTFSQHAKAYVRATPYRLEEEKMAVLLQQVVGAGAWQPLLSGFLRRGAIAQFLSGGTGHGRGWICRRRLGPGTRRGRRGKVADLQSAPSPASGAVFVGRRYSGELADRVLGARTESSRCMAKNPADELREVASVWTWPRPMEPCRCWDPPIRSITMRSTTGSAGAVHAWSALPPS